jgi:hypothetical protein
MDKAMQKTGKYIVFRFIFHTHYTWRLSVKRF